MTCARTCGVFAGGGCRNVEKGVCGCNQSHASSACNAGHAQLRLLTHVLGMNAHGHLEISAKESGGHTHACINAHACPAGRGLDGQSPFAKLRASPQNVPGLGGKGPCSNCHSIAMHIGQLARLEELGLPPPSLDGVALCAIFHHAASCGLCLAPALPLGRHIHACGHAMHTCTFRLGHAGGGGGGGS